jgi:hypothetical protein
MSKITSVNMARFFDTPSSEEERFIGDPDGQPFTVIAHSNNWIPLSVLIYAQNGQDAIKRVQDFLKLVVLESKSKIQQERAQKILNLTFTATVFDKRFVAKVAWAGNDTLA